MEYIALVEQHRTGWPHVNILVHHPAFVKAAQADWQAVRRDVNDRAQQCGWGLRLWLEPLRSEEAIAGYLAKLAAADWEKEAAAAAGEIAKPSQAPVDAPRGFRRLRASHHLLPSKYKNPEWTGNLSAQDVEIEARVHRECGWTIEPHSRNSSLSSGVQAGYIARLSSGRVSQPLGSVEKPTAALSSTSSAQGATPAPIVGFQVDPRPAAVVPQTRHDVPGPEVAALVARPGGWLVNTRTTHSGHFDMVVGGGVWGAELPEGGHGPPEGARPPGCVFPTVRGPP